MRLCILQYTAFDAIRVPRPAQRSGVGRAVGSLSTLARPTPFGRWPWHPLSMGFGRCTVIAGFIATALALGQLGGCQQAPELQPWSTKDESALGASAEPAAIDMGDQIPVAVDPKNLRASAVEILRAASESTNPLLRAHAIEALQATPDQLEPVVRRGLADENRGVRFASAMTIGRLKMTALAPLLEPLLHDDSQSVQAAAMYGLARNGRPVDLNALAAMLIGEDPEVKGNAALVLGELGEPSAIGVLRYSVGRGLERVSPARRKVVDLQLAEAMAKLGETQELDVIRAALFSPADEGEMAALAAQMLGELRDAGVLPNLIDLALRTGRGQRSAEVRMTAAKAVAQIEPARAPLEVPLNYAHSDRFELRAQAANTLGAMNDEKVLAHLARLMDDHNPLVQVTAAGAVLRQRQRN